MSAVRLPRVCVRAGAALARAGLAAGLLAIGSAPGAAQEPWGEVGVFDAHRRVYYYRSAYAQAGRLITASGTLRVGPVRLDLGTERGELKASTPVPNCDVRVRSDAAGVSLALGRFLSVGATREVWRFTADAGVTSWVLQGGVVRFEPDFGLVGLRGIADVSVFTKGGVRDGPRLSRAFRTVMGVSVSPRSLPVSLRLSHRFERIDLRAATADPESIRYEEFRGILIEVSMPARR